MVGGISPTCQVLVGPAIQVKVLPTDDAIAGIANPTLTLVHGVNEMTEEDAAGRLVAAVGVILAGVVRFTHL